MKRLQKEEGHILATTAFGLAVLIGFAAWAIDVSYFMTARTQLQNAVDAAALAGASGLLMSTDEATNRAIQFAGRNDCINVPVQISAADIAFPTSRRIRVTATRRLNTFFLRVFGVPQVSITRTATAELAQVISTTGLRPWCVPNWGWSVGDIVTLKEGDSPGNPASFYYPVDFPPINRGNPSSGASAYRASIEHGTSSDVSIGDVLQVEPGKMVGPTKQGVDYLIGLDPNARWSNDAVVGSSYAGLSSPRIVKVPLFDPAILPDNGRSSVTVVALAAFFIEGFQGKDVVGRFIRIFSSGNVGNGVSMLYQVRLIL